MNHPKQSSQAIIPINYLNESSQSIGPIVAHCYQASMGTLQILLSFPITLYLYSSVFLYRKLSVIALVSNRYWSSH
jgi:hypothetical protein